MDFSLLEEFDPSRGVIFYKAEPMAAIKAANDSPVFRDFFRFSQFPLERATPLAEPEGATRVEAMDMRFGTPAQTALRGHGGRDNRLQVMRAWFSFGAVEAALMPSRRSESCVPVPASSSILVPR